MIRPHWVALVVIALPKVLLADAAWPGFMGPIDVAVDPAGLPMTWGPEENVAWAADLPGYGQSSPVCWNGRAFVTSVSGDMKEEFHVTAWNLADGSKVWQHDVEAASKVENTAYTSRAAPTPVVDESGLVVFCESGNLLALDHDGKVTWVRDLVAEYGAISSRHGLSSSLVAHGGHVFVWVERGEEPYVLAVDRGTGKTAWKVAGLGATTWSTPTLLHVDGDATHLVLSASGLLVGLNPADGERLWTIDDITGNTTPRPQPIGGGRLLVGASVGRGQGDAGASARCNGVVQVEKTDDGWKADYVWRAERATSSFGSPIAHDGRAYFVNRTGVLFCLDLETGGELFAERLPASIWATPLAVGDRVYFAGKSGETTVVKAADDFEKLAENQLWEGERKEPGDFTAHVQYAVAAVPGRLLIRRGDRLYCLVPKSTETNE